LKTNKNQCPDCDSREFISSLIQYDILKFADSKPEVIHSECINDEYRIYCRECGREVDIEKSKRSGKIHLKPE